MPPYTRNKALDTTTAAMRRRVEQLTNAHRAERAARLAAEQQARNAEQQARAAEQRARNAEQQLAAMARRADRYHGALVDATRVRDDLAARNADLESGVGQLWIDLETSYLRALAGTAARRPQQQTDHRAA